jgi:hypothetical protein
MEYIMKKWYAVMRDNEDTDWGTGSTRLREAAKMVRKMRREGDEEAFIAVIDITSDDMNAQICIDEIRDVRGL